ncbi:MAG: hypothetical protein KBD78_11275 [Oligoflexales bacterium]|nr:hypothetical protein [Oligoflexales bacterium]
MNKSNIISLALGLSLVGCGSANGFLGKEDKKASADVTVQHSEKNAALGEYLQKQDSAILYRNGEDAICKKENPGHTDPGEIVPLPADEERACTENYGYLANKAGECQVYSNGCAESELKEKGYTLECSEEAIKEIELAADKGEQDLNNIDYGDSKPPVDSCNIEPGIDFISVLVCSAGGLFSVVDSNGKISETTEVKESCVKHICYQTYRTIGEQVPAIFHEGQEDKFVSEPKSLLEETELVWVCEEDGINQSLPEGSTPGGEATVDPESAE